MYTQTRKLPNYILLYENSTGYCVIELKHLHGERFLNLPTLKVTNQTEKHMKSILGIFKLTKQNNLYSNISQRFALLFIIKMLPYCIYINLI